MTERTEASPKKGPQFFDEALKQPVFDEALKQPEFKLMDAGPLEDLLEKAIDAIADVLEAALPATKASENSGWCAYFWPGYNATTLGAQAMRIAKRRKSNENSDKRNIEGGYLLFNPKEDSNYSDTTRELAAPIELGFRWYLSDAENIGLPRSSIGSTHNWLMLDNCNINILEVEFCKTSAQKKDSEGKRELPNQKFLQLVVSSAKDIRNEIKKSNLGLPAWPEMAGTSDQDVDDAIQRYNLWFATFLDSTRCGNLNSESVREQGKANLVGTPQLKFFDDLRYWYSFATEKAQDGNGELKSLGSGMLLTSHQLEEQSLRIFRRWLISCYWSLRALELTLAYRRVGISYRSRGLQHEMKDFAKSFIQILDFPVRDLGLKSAGCGSRVLQRVEHQDTKDRNCASLFLVPGDRRLYASMIAPLISYFENPVETLSRFVTGKIEESMALDELLRLIVKMCYWSLLEEIAEKSFLGVDYVNIKQAILLWLNKGWEEKNLLELPEVELEHELPIKVDNITSSLNKKFCSAEAWPLLHALVPLVRNALKHWRLQNNSKTTVEFEYCVATQSLQIRFHSELTKKGQQDYKPKNRVDGTAGAIRAALSWQEKPAVELKCFDLKENGSRHCSVVTLDLRSLCGQ